MFAPTLRQSSTASGQRSSHNFYYPEDAPAVAGYAQARYRADIPIAIITLFYINL